MATVPADRTIFFPPFPPVPSGVQIIPFKDFHECGIQVEGDGDVELDGRGIPTAELKNPRKGDEPKSNARKKRLLNVAAENQRRAAVSESASKKVLKFGKPSIKEWWHEWDDGESGRRSVVDRQAQTSFLVVHQSYLPSSPLHSSLMPFDRVIQAANDFAKNRKWPSSLSNVRESWEKYRYYLGILENVPARGKKTNLEDFDDEAGSDDDDNFGNDVFEEAPTSSSKQSKGKQRCSPFVETQTHDDASTSVKLTPEDKLAAFLADTERNARVFLSSYMKYRGLMWADYQLVYIPRLLNYFLSYLVRSEIFDPTRFPYASPRSSPSEANEINQDLGRIHRGLVASLSVVDKALHELPLTAVMSQWIEPFSVSDSAKSHWGRKADGANLTFTTMQPETNTNNTNTTTSPDKVGVPEEAPEWGASDKKKKHISLDSEPSAKRPRVGDDHDAPIDLGEKMDVDTFVNPPWMQPKEVNNAGQKVEASLFAASNDTQGVSANVVEQGWGSNAGGGWGSTNASWGKDDAADDPQPSGFGDIWDTANSASSWALPSTPTFETLLGPLNTFTKTHMPGFVESSLRRIKQILKPGEGVDEKDLTKEPSFDCDDPEEMELQLARRFVRVVLEPWLDTDVKQRAGEMSVGRIESQRLTDGQTGLPGKGLPLNNGHRSKKVHNLLGDELTILIDAQGDKEAEILEILDGAVGMGIGGYFVELARAGDNVGSSPAATGGDWDDRVDDDRDDGRRYWYLEEFTRAYPSYWLPLGLKTTS